MDAITQRLDQQKLQIDELSRATFDVEVVRPDGSIITGAVTAHGGLLRLDFSQ
jgi:hypothetical protein